jgi:hypothetical protein
MATFVGVTDKSGVDPKVHFPFMALAEGGAGVVMLKDAKGSRVTTDKKNKITVTEITSSNYSAATNALSAQFGKWNLTGSKKPAQFLAELHKQFGLRQRLILVQAKHTGETVINVGTSAHINVSVMPAKIFNIAFRFVQLTSGKKTKNTKWGPGDAQDLLNILNWTFGPQANVSFKLVDAIAAPATVGSDIDLDETFKGTDLKTLFLGTPNAKADVTIYFVKDYVTTDNDGFSQTFAAEKACAVVDNPPPVVIKGEDPFETTFCHEICHFLQNTKQPSEIGKGLGHHDREGVLMSEGRESQRMDEGLIRRVNAP